MVERDVCALTINTELPPLNTALSFVNRDLTLLYKGNVLLMVASYSYNSTDHLSPEALCPSD